MTRPVERRLLVLARAPVSGRAKTRLISTLGAEGAAAVYRHVLEHVLGEASRLPDTATDLWCDAEDDDHEACNGLASRFGMTLHIQKGRGLGTRMRCALEAALETAGRAVLIGSDCPDIDSDYLARAFTELEGHDAVLGPAEDGGYVLIGLRKAVPRLFRDIPWGTDRVLGLTRARLRDLDWSWTELPTLRDLDRPSDLAHFPRLAALAGGATRNQPRRRTTP